MSHITQHIHGVTKLEVSHRGLLAGTDVHTTDITVYDASGGQISIVLFSDGRLPWVQKVGPS